MLPSLNGEPYKVVYQIVTNGYTLRESNRKAILYPQQVRREEEQETERRCGRRRHWWPFGDTQ